MPLHEPLYESREEAGQRIGKSLMNHTLYSPLVLGIPRGGVVVASALADVLKADLDVVLSMKLRAPYHPEFALGAMAENGEVFLNPHTSEVNDFTESYLTEEKFRVSSEMSRRREVFRKIRASAPIRGRSIIITDDGIATGSTILPAIRTTRAESPREIIVAVPVGSPDRLEKVARECDELICLHRPEAFWAVGEFYRNFFSVDEEEVCRLLQESLLKAS